MSDKQIILDYMDCTEEEISADLDNFIFEDVVIAWNENLSSKYGIYLEVITTGNDYVVATSYYSDKLHKVILIDNEIVKCKTLEDLLQTMEDSVKESRLLENKIK